MEGALYYLLLKASVESIVRNSRSKGYFDEFLHTMGISI